MAEMKVPIKIDGFKCVEDMVQAVLNYTYKEKTLKEWADSISKPQTNADRIRAMTDEELASFIYDHSCAFCPMDDCDGRMNIGRDACYKRWLDWLKQEVENNE
jgi:hypothetical protein